MRCNTRAHGQEKTQAEEEKRERSPIYNYKAKNVNSSNPTIALRSLFQSQLSFSQHEIENLIQCIGPHVVVSTTGKTTAPNGIISLETKVLATICFFAGGSAYDIFPLLGIGHTSLFRCVWAVVHAINKTPDMRIDFLHEHSKQCNIARGFKKKALLGLIVALAALKVCWYGQRNQLNRTAQS